MTEISDVASGTDRRRPPFCFQTHDALDLIREHFTGGARSTALAIYLTMTEIANRKGGAEARSGFRATRKQIASHAGVGVTTFDRYVRDFEALGLIEITRERVGEVNLPNRWALIDSPSETGPGDDPLVAPVGGGAPVPVPLRARSSSEEEKTFEEDPPVAPPSTEVALVHPANRPLTVNKKPVTNDEYDLASDVLAAFNAAAGTRYSSRLVFEKIIRRIREHPEVTLEHHRAIIANNFADPWWKDNPAPEVIYGNASIFERSAHKQPAADGAVSPEDAATYGTEWGPGTDFTTAAAARAARSSRFAGADVVDAEHWEVHDEG